MSLVSAPSTSPGRIFSLRPPRICSVTIGATSGLSEPSSSSDSLCHSVSRLLQHLDVADAAHLVHAGQVQREAFLAGAAGAADAVHVLLGLVGDVDVDHALQLRDVEAARGHVGGHQHRAAAVGELDQHLVAVALLEVAVQRDGLDAFGGEHVHQVAALLLGVAERDGRGRLVVAQQAADGVQALVGVTSYQSWRICAARGATPPSPSAGCA